MKIRWLRDDEGVWAAASRKKRIMGAALSILFLVPLIALVVLLAYLFVTRIL